jgi:branched-chain amino acid transport system ATP-binding protein
VATRRVTRSRWAPRSRSLGLAPKLVEQILERLVGVTQAGTSVLLVDQDVDAALEVASHGYVLENGRVIAAGDSASLLEDSRIRAAYLGVSWRRALCAGRRPVPAPRT